MAKYRLVMCVLLLAALLTGACVPSATPRLPTAIPEPVTINNICAHKGERSDIQGILRLPDSLSCTRNENPNWCTVQLYDPYFDKTLAVSLYVSPSGLSPNQMASIPKNYGLADFKVQTGTGGLVGHGSLVSLSGKIGAAGQPAGGSNEVACALSDVQQVTALKQLSPVGIEVKKYDLADAINNGAVLASINGRGLGRLDLKLKPQVNFNLEINILPGTLFESLMGGVQNMIVRKGALAVLKPNVELSLELEVSCANMEKKQPTGGDMFKISKSPAARDLLKLVDLAEFPFSSNRVQQFAVWSITDNPPLGYFVGIDTASGIRGGPTAAEVVEIRRLFTAAGIDLAPYNVFK